MINSNQTKIQGFFRLTIVIITFSFIFISSSFGQWIRQNIPPGEGLILCADFRDSQNGIIGGWNLNFDVYGKSFYSTNGGNNWLASNIPDSVRAIVDIKFISDNTAFAVGAYNPIMYSAGRKSQNDNSNFLTDSYRNIGMFGEPFYSGLFMKTTNAGISWFTYGNIPSSYSYLYQIEFQDSQNAYMIGSFQDYNELFARMCKSIDGGNNWFNLTLPLDTGNLSALQCINSHIFAAGDEKNPSITNPYSGVIIRSADNGLNWSKMTFNDINNFTDIKFSNGNTGYASGFDAINQSLPNSKLYRTTNAGLNWIPLNLDLDSIIIHGIGVCQNTGTVFIFGNKTVDTEMGYIFTECLVYRSSNYGENWTSQSISIPYSGFLTNSFFLDSYNAYLTGAYMYNVFPKVYIDPYVFHTTNAGSTFINNNSTNTLNSFYLSQNFPNPFNPSTTISYYLPSNSFVNIKVYDVIGIEIQTLVDQKQNAGNYNVQFNGAGLSSGVYFYKLTTDTGFVETKKMLLTK